jgi:hypothetical protein
MTCKGTSLSGSRRSAVDVRASRLTTRFAVLMGGSRLSLVFMKIGYNDNPDKGHCGALRASSVYRCRRLGNAFAFLLQH